MGFQLSDINFSVFIGQKVIEVSPVVRELANIKFNGGSLNIECSWQVRSKQSILVGCTERKETIPAKIMRKHLLNKAIVNIYCFVPTEDLTIEFEGELYLDLFCDSSIFEQYQLYKGERIFLIGR